MYWTGVDCITARSPQYPNGHYTGFDTVCGGSSTVTYGAVSGEYIGADPMAFDQTKPSAAKSSSTGCSATATTHPTEHHHDVNCLRTLSYDYHPNGVQGRAL